MVVALALGAIAGCPGQEDSPNNTAPEPDATKTKESTSAAKPGPRTELIEGYYVLDDPAFYLAKSMSEVPPGRVMHLAAKDGRWMMMDMLIGYGGTYEETESGAIFTSVMGPAGPTKAEELTVTTTSKGITLAAPPGGGMSLEFSWQRDAIPKEFDFDAFLGKRK